MSKFISMAMVITIAGSLSAASARAQSSVPRYYGSVTPTAYDNIEYYNEADDKSPSDKAPMPAAPGTATPAPAAAAPAAPATDAGAACTSCGGGSSGCEDCCKLTCPDQTVKRLFGDCCWLKCHDITVQGWMEAGYAWRDGSRNPDGFNGPDGFNDRDEEFLLDQFYTTIQKALKDNQCCWDWGFTVDLLYGTDYRYPLSKGLDARDDGTPKWHTDDRRLYGLALPQAYLEFGTQALSYKVGHFYTLLGNEVVPAIGNVFYSHTYIFLYAYPFTHTGALATYKPNDQLTIVNGIDEGWDNFNDTDENPGYTGQAIFTAKDKHTTLTFAWQFSNEPIVSGGNPTADPEARHGRFIESTVLSHDWNDRTSYVVESCFGSQSAGEAEGDTSTWYGIDGYVTYKNNCCWTSAARFEWFRDSDGTRVAPVGDFATPTNNNVASVGGFAGSFYDITFGANYHPNANVQFRPEIRYDWFSGQDLNGVKPYLAGTSNHQWIYSTDMIWQY
jgi:Putative beta-barrel porin-2, OmpL-like. bbp2